MIFDNLSIGILLFLVCFASGIKELVKGRNWFDACVEATFNSILIWALMDFLQYAKIP